jgi:hypothetical protein
MDMERFYLKKLNEGEVKEQYHVTIKKKFAVWKTYRLIVTSIGHLTLLERTPNFRPTRVSVIVNRSIIKAMV